MKAILVALTILILLAIAPAAYAQQYYPPAPPAPGADRYVNVPISTSNWWDYIQSRYLSQTDAQGKPVYRYVGGPFSDRRQLYVILYYIGRAATVAPVVVMPQSTYDYCAAYPYAQGCYNPYQ